MDGHIFQIHISSGGVPKHPRPRGLITEAGLAGDKHDNMEHHGGPQRALCLYSLEQILELQEEGQRVYPGSLGENLTLSGLNWSEVAPGARLRLGDEVQIEITRYTSPCRTIAHCFLEGDFNRVNQMLRPGWSRVYAKVIQGGAIRVGQIAALL